MNNHTVQSDYHTVSSTISISLFLSSLHLHFTLIIFCFLTSFEDFDGWVTTNVIGVTKSFARCSAICVSNKNFGVIFESFSKLVPIRFHPFTVSSPRRKEFDKCRLSCSQRVKVFLGQFDSWTADSDSKERCDNNFCEHYLRINEWKDS